MTQHSPVIITDGLQTPGPALRIIVLCTCGERIADTQYDVSQPWAAIQKSTDAALARGHAAWAAHSGAHEGGSQ